MNNHQQSLTANDVLYLYPDIYPCSFSRDIIDGKYRSLNSPQLYKSLIIRAAEIVQLVSLERRSLFRPWSSEPCQGRGREFESRFPLHKVSSPLTFFFVPRPSVLHSNSRPRVTLLWRAGEDMKGRVTTSQTWVRVSFSAPQGQ